MADRNLRIRMLMEAADRVSRPLRDITGGSRRAAEALRGTREQLRGIGAQQEQLNAFRTLRTGMARSEQAMKQAQARAAALGREMAQTANPTREMSRAFEQAKRDAAQLTQQHRSQTQQLQDLRRRLRETGIDTRDLARHERELRDRARETTREMEEQARELERLTRRQQRFGEARDRFDRTMNTGRNVAGAGMAAAGTAVAVATPIIASAKASMDLEEGMAGVAKVTGLADDQIAIMRGSLVNLSTQIPMTAAELANITAAAGSAGVGGEAPGKSLKDRRDELIAFTGDAAKMGIAFDMTADEAGGTMAKWRQAFGITQPAVVALGDRINALTNKYGGQASAVGGVITRVGALGGVAGVAAPQIAALASSLNSIGIEEDVAATGIKALMLTLNKGTAAAKSQKDAFKALKLDAVAVSKAMQVDGSGTIVDVLERIRKLPKDQQAASLSQLFGTESVGAIAPLLTNLDKLKERLALVSDESKYSGSMMGEFLTRINTTKGAFDLAVNGLQSVNLEMGQQLLPHIKAGAQYVSGLAARMRVWAAANPNVAKGVMYLAGGAAALFAVFALGAIVIAALMAPFAAVSFASTALGFKFGAAMLKIGRGLLWVGKLLPMLGRGFMMLGMTIARAGLALLANPVTWIVLAIVAAVALLAYGAYKLYQNWDGVVAWFGNLWAGIKGFFSSGIGNISATILSWSPIGMFYRVFAGVLNWFGVSLPSTFAGFGRMMIGGLVNGIRSAAGSIWGALKGAIGGAVSLFRRLLGIRSPSRLFMGFGGYMMQGLHNGIDNGADGPINRIGRLSRDLSGALALGVATPALAGALPPSGSTGGVTSGGTGPRTYNITVNAGAGNPADIEAAVRRAIESVERENAARQRSQFADAPDWNV